MQTALLDPPLSGSERDIILGFIDFQQRVFLRKLEDKNGNLLPEEQLTKQLPPSSMTLKGMASHLWFVEDYWREKILLGRELPEPGFPRTGTLTGILTGTAINRSTRLLPRCARAWRKPTQRSPPPIGMP